VDTRLSAARDNHPPQRHTTSTRTPVIADTGADTTAQAGPARRSSRTADRAARRHHNPNHNGTAAAGGDALTTNNPNAQPERDEVNADKADEAGTLTVIVQPQDFRLPDVLRHIEAGKIVLVLPQHNSPH
jgi:hypothetical protein